MSSSVDDSLLLDTLSDLERHTHTHTDTHTHTEYETHTHPHTHTHTLPSPHVEASIDALIDDAFDIPHTHTHNTQHKNENEKSDTHTYNTQDKNEKTENLEQEDAAHITRIHSALEHLCTNLNLNLHTHTHTHTHTEAEKEKQAGVNEQGKEMDMLSDILYEAMTCGSLTYGVATANMIHNFGTKVTSIVRERCNKTRSVISKNIEKKTCSLPFLNSLLQYVDTALSYACEIDTLIQLTSDTQAQQNTTQNKKQLKIQQDKNMKLILKNAFQIVSVRNDFDCAVCEAHTHIHALKQIFPDEIIILKENPGELVVSREKMEDSFKQLLTFNEAVAEDMYKFDENDLKKFEEEFGNDANEDLSELLNNPMLESLLSNLDDEKMMELLDGIKNLAKQE